MLYRSLDITRDKPGLAHARELLAVLRAAVGVADIDLPWQAGSHEAEDGRQPCRVRRYRLDLTRGTPAL